jgi:predicted nucleic acid-binding protein
VTDKRLPRVYADANIIIEFAKQARKLHDTVRENDLWFFGQMLRAAGDGVIEVLTSSISLAECTHIKDDTDPTNIQVIYDQTLQEFLRRLISSGTLIKLVQDSVFVAEKARDLLWKHGLRLKPADSIHIASALDAECGEFLSWDTDVNKQNMADKISKLRAEGLAVILPSQSQILPVEYKQGHLLRDSKVQNGQENTELKDSSNPARLRADNSSGAGDPAGTKAKTEKEDA